MGDLGQGHVVGVGTGADKVGVGTRVDRGGVWGTWVRVMW